MYISACRLIRTATHIRTYHKYGEHYSLCLSYNDPELETVHLEIYFKLCNEIMLLRKIWHKTKLAYRLSIKTSILVIVSTECALLGEQSFTSSVLGQQRYAVLQWPPYSPDLSPIKHLCDELDRRVNRIMNNRNQLRNALVQE